MNKFRCFIRNLLLLTAVLLAFSAVKAQAYTESEKQQAKSWLSSHGYSPTMDGAYAAYDDWLNGKWWDEFGSPDDYFGGDDEEDEAEEETEVREPETKNAGDLLADAAENLLDSLSVFVPAGNTAVGGPGWFIRLIGYTTAAVDELRHWAESAGPALRSLGVCVPSASSPFLPSNLAPSGSQEISSP